MATRKLNVQSFPRPPLLEKISRHLQIKWMGTVIADTRDAYWVLETHHPPSAFILLSIEMRFTTAKPRTPCQALTPAAYYLPPESLKVPLTRTSRKTYCEWKGSATYYSIATPGSPSNSVANRVWSYDNPTRGFEPLQGCLSFYAEPWDCFVDGEKVEAQPGDFYGGWVTSDIDGIVKGRHGNFDPIV
jgi:uncharacterized protein (DUF427 family)